MNDTYRGVCRKLCGVLLVALSVGCGDTEAARLDAERALLRQSSELAELLTLAQDNEITDGEALVFRLAFGAEADLDLYVTDPLLETVYFANHRSKTGGAIVRDIRCDDSGPRVEEVRFEHPYPGRYRVGVDNPERCDGERAPAAFAVSVAGAGVSHHVRGAAPVEQFQLIVLEFELTEGAARATEGVQP